jgi:hypothetical protein
MTNEYEANLVLARLAVLIFVCRGWWPGSMTRVKPIYRRLGTQTIAPVAGASTVR